MNRQHLECRYNGPNLFVVDVGNRNGTSIIGQSGRIPPNKAVHVDDDTQIDVANVL